MKHRLVVALFGLVALPGQGNERPGAPVFPVGTDLVHVTVTARDRSGQLVQDLRAEDFSVYEDGRPQALKLFAPALQPGQDQALALDLGLLLDTSESMARELRLSQEAALRFLETIPRARDLLTIFFDQDIRISRYQGEQQQGLFERILAARASGNTALYDAIAVYLARVGDSPGRKVMVLLTDGEDSTSALSSAELIRLVRSSPVTIYSIAFTGQLGAGSGRAMASQAFLRELANLTGGDVFAPRRSDELPAIYDKILDELGAQYVLGFMSDNSRHDGRYRKLKVKPKRKDIRLRHRAGYFAPAER